MDEDRRDLEERGDDRVAGPDGLVSPPAGLEVASGGWLPTATPARWGANYRVYTLLPKTTFSWGNVATGGRLTYELGLPLDVVAVPELVLVVRVHALGVSSARATFVLEGTSRSDDEPEVAYAWVLPLATIVVDAGATVGGSQVAAARCDVSPLVRARLHLDQPGGPARDSVTLSAELGARAPFPEKCPCPIVR